MASESRITVAAAFRKYYQEELESMIRQMKIEGGTLDDCIAELKILADFVQSRAAGLIDAWPNLLKDTACEQWEQRQNEAGITGVPMGKSEVQPFADLTVKHEVVAGTAVVYPSALGAALSRVDSDWYHKI